MICVAAATVPLEDGLPSVIIAAMVGRALSFAILFVAGVGAACFQSDFVLYGPECQAAEACAGVVGDGSDRRVCFFPEPDPAASRPGYCSVECDPDADPCQPHGGEFQLECITRSRAEGGSLSVCALTCEPDGDCPGSMSCEPDPKGGTSWLCIP